MPMFYFSRIAEPDRFASRFLISGVIDRETIEEAKTWLDQALQRARHCDRSDNFAFVNLSTIQPTDEGLRAITMGGQ